ncbi:DNA repair protein RAD50 [Nymphon striatum]|nr:DNA repair protein RAD50 [Nymphon striatum]
MIKLENIDTSAAILDQIDDELSIAEQELDKNGKSFDDSAVQKEISTAENSLKDLNLNLDKTRKESSKARQLTEVRTKLDHLKKDRIAKDSSVKKLYSKHEETLIALLGFVPKENAKSMILEFLNEKSNEVNSQRNVLNASNIKLSKLETTRASFLDQISNLKNELNVSKDKIFNVCGSQPYSTVLKALEESIDALQKEKGAVTGSRFLYKKFIEKLQNSSPSSCPLCHREFDDPTEASVLANELNDLVKTIPSRMTEKTNKLTTEKTKYNDVLQIKPIEEMHSKLSNADIPELEKKIKKIEKEIEELRQIISEGESSLSTVMHQESSARSISNDMGLLDQFQIELKKLNQQISSNSSMFQGDSVRTLQEIENDQQQIESKMNLLRQSIQSKKEQRDQYKTSIFECRDKITKLKEERQSISETLNQKLTLEESKAKLIANNKQLASQILDAKNQMEPVENNLRLLEAQKTKQFNEKEKFVEQKYQESDMILSISPIEAEEDIIYFDIIKYYIENEKENILRDKNDKLIALKQSIEEFKGKSDKLKATIDDLKQRINQQEIHQRDLEDNLEIKKIVKEIRKLSEDVKQNEETYDKMDVDSFESEKNKLNKAHNSFFKDSQLAVGRQSELKESIRRLEQELKNPDYRDAVLKYNNKMIEMKTNEIAATDLVKYHDALDRALNQYHRVKMAAVNKIIRELWQLTYKGNDIDYIEIDCGEEPGNRGIKRNVYNYRVVLVKSNISLDMRGRCSAGQRVLASLIIRLALAETFCLQCGILTLDEPTTNLDRSNIESLAEALKNIVEMRSELKNFQLVIITHDEEFIELLGRGRCAEYFYKVSKNDQ